MEWTTVEGMRVLTWATVKIRVTKGPLRVVTVVRLEFSIVPNIFPSQEPLVIPLVIRENMDWS